MASPFSIFRKYSGGLMIIMVILSMLLFTLTDLFSDPDANLWLLGLLLGGAVFGIAGIGQGRWLQWGLGGAVLGTALGYILPGFLVAGGINTNLGVIDRDKINDLVIRRQIANQVVGRACETALDRGTAWWYAQRYQFGFGQGNIERDVIFGELLRAEADRLGIVVTEEMVGDYVGQMVGSQLTQEQFVEIRNSLVYQNQPLTDPVLTDIMRDEMRARIAYRLTQPLNSTWPPAPEVYWDYYKRLNVKQEINVAAIDVDAFLDQVDEPSDADVEAAFAKYSRRYPNSEEPGSMGFRLPNRVQLAYVEMDSKQAESEVAEVTDADVEKYYEENKETFRTPVLLDSSDDSNDATETGDGNDDAETADNPESDGNETDRPESSPEPPAEPTEAEADPESEESAAEVNDNAEAEATDDPTDPTETEEASEEDAESGNAEPESVEDSTDADESPDETEEGAGEESAVEGSREEIAADTTDDSAQQDTEAKSETTTDSAETSVEGSEAATGTESADDSEKMSLVIPGVPEVPTDDEASSAGEDSSADEQPSGEIKYEYKELDDELRQDIRDEILRQRVDALISKKIAAVKAKMDSLASQRNLEHFNRIEKNPEAYESQNENSQEAFRKLRMAMKPFDGDIGSQLKKYANANGLAYVETPFVSFFELVDGEDYPIGLATKPTGPTANPLTAPQEPNVARTLFSSFSDNEQQNDAQLFTASDARLSGAGPDGVSNHYVYWAVDFSIEHVPTLDEPGVRESVILALKREQAQKLAEARGQELVDSVVAGLANEGDERADMATTLKEATITGGTDSAAVAVRKSRRFSWLKTSTAPQQSLRTPPVQLSQIIFEDAVGGELERVGNRFMESIFSDMSDEEVKVVPNGDLSQYLVVHVTNRFPTPEIGEDALQQRFAAEGQQMAFRQNPMLRPMQNQISGPADNAWVNRIWTRYGVDFNSE